MFVPAVVVVLARSYGIGWLQQLLRKIFGIGGQQLAQESRVPECEGIEMGNIGPSQESRSTRREEIETDNNEPPQGPHATEPVGTERDNAQPSSSSSTTRPLRTSEPQEPVLGMQWGEIREEW